MAQEIHVGDIGTVFRFTIKDDNVIVDVSTASIMKLHFLKPDGKGGVTKVPKTAVHTTDGIDGVIEYVGESGFLSPTSFGNWRVQAEITFPSGNKWSGEVGEFPVHENIF